MADAVEIINGVGSMYSFREPAWHGLGTVVTEEHTTSEVMDIANLSNWNKGYWQSSRQFEARQRPLMQGLRGTN